MTGAAFNRSVNVFISRHLSPQERSRVLAAFAKRQVGELIRLGAASPDFERYVDGRQGAPEETVKAEGRIRYLFNHLGAVTVFALSFLQARAPAKSGAYRNSFYVGVNGRFVPMAQFRPDKVPNDAEIVIGNTQPYSRKVDVQMVGGRKLRFSVPPGLFEDCVRAVKARFASTKAKRVYNMTFPGRYKLRQEQTHLTGHRAGRSRGRLGSMVESPAMIINPKS